MQKETEMERLKRNTEIEKYNQARDEIIAYIKELDEEIMDRIRWHNRARNLEFIVLLIYFGSFAALGLQGIPYEGWSWIPDITFTLWIICSIRAHVIHTQQIGAIREQVGAIKTLRIIGMIKEDHETPRTKKRVKRFSPFARYKEFWERVTEKNLKDKYA